LTSMHTLNQVSISSMPFGYKLSSMRISITFLLVIIAVIASVNGSCCWKVHVRLSGTRSHTPGGAQVDLGGLYKMLPGLVNGKPHWRQVDGATGIWTDQHGNWIIGDDDDRGRNLGGVFSDEQDNCPTTVHKWQFYHDGELKDEQTWKNEIDVVCW